MPYVNPTDFLRVIGVSTVNTLLNLKCGIQSIEHNARAFPFLGDEKSSHVVRIHGIPNTCPIAALCCKDCIVRLLFVGHWFVRKTQCYRIKQITGISNMHRGGNGGPIMRYRNPFVF